MSLLNRPQRALYLFVLLVLPAAATAGGLPKLAKLAQHGALVSAKVVDLDNGKTIAEIRPSLRLTPASLTKLATAAAAFEHWHADHQFKTRLLIDTVIRNGVIPGNLILQGAGDASFNGRALLKLASQIKGAGISKINGNLQVVQSPFGPMPCGTPDRCKALESSDTAYNAPISPVGVDYGNWCVLVRPGAPGTPAQVGACAATRLPIPVQGTIKTVPSNRSPSFWIERRTDSDGDHLQVGGEIPAGRSVPVYRAMSNPALGTGKLLVEMLRELGVKVTDHAVVTAGAPPDDAYTIASVKCQSVREQMDGMLRYSNNYIADSITMDMAADFDPPQPTDLAKAGQYLANFVARASNYRNGKPTLLSGSGLTPGNRLSADDLIGLLNTMYHDAQNFPAFYGGLVVPRQAPFAFLRRGDPAWLDRVVLKTGTMNDPRSVFGIAGYMRKRHGGWMDFAIIVNGSKHHKHVPLYKSLAAARGDIQSILAHH